MLNLQTKVQFSIGKRRCEMAATNGGWKVRQIGQPSKYVQTRTDLLDTLVNWGATKEEIAELSTTADALKL